MAAPIGNKFAQGLENSGRPPMYSDPDLMIGKITEYFDQGNKYTITGLCLHLGFESRQSFYDYEKKKEFAYIVKRARLVIEQMHEEALSGNSPTGSIFALKNMGWIDKQEVKHEGEGLTITFTKKQEEGLNYILGESDEEAIAGN